MAPLRVWIHPNVEHWQLETYKKGNLVSTSNEALTIMKNNAKFPTASWNIYLLRDKIPPLWEDKSVKDGGMFSLDMVLSQNIAEAHSQSLKFIDFVLKDKIVFKNGNEINTDSYFIGISFSISRRGVVSPKFWLKDCSQYVEANLALVEAFPKYEFTFQTFGGKSDPVNIAAADAARNNNSSNSSSSSSSSKKLIPVKASAANDSTAQQITAIFNTKLSSDTLTATIAAVKKIVKNGDTNELENIIVKHIYQSSSTNVGLLIELIIEIDFIHDNLMDRVLDKMGTVVIEHDDAQTTIKLFQNLSIARSRLILHMYIMTRISRKVVSDHIDSVLAAKQLDVVIEMLKCLAMCKDEEFLTRIRNNLTSETKKAGKIYYLMLDIFDEIAAQ